MTYAAQHVAESIEILQKLDTDLIDRIAKEISLVRDRGGRLFFLGVGGSAANCSHAVNDFRKICGIECYAPTDNVSELTARVNDEGWETVFESWLRTSKLNADDGIFIFSVGGGDSEKNISPNLCKAIDLAVERKSSILGVVGRDGGYTARNSDLICIIPTVNSVNVTPHSEAFQALVWHLLVSHNRLKVQQTKWEETLSPV